MCYTPAVSITTAIIEFILAAILLFKYPKATLKYFFALFLLMLGLYQFTEFMLCKTGHDIFWVRAGFIVYSFLPALGLHAALFYLKSKINRFLLYTVPVALTLTAFTNDQIWQGTCNTIFITTKTILSQHPTLFLIYITYYVSFTLLICWLSIKEYSRVRTHLKRIMSITWIIAILLMSVPTFVLIIIFPELGIRFPSILCHFALLLALVIFIGVRMEHQLRSKQHITDLKQKK